MFSGIKKLPKRVVEVELEFFRTVSTMLISAVGLVAALAWNTAIDKIFSLYLNQERVTALSWVIYASVVTLIAVLVTLYMGRVAKAYETRIQQFNDTSKKE